jgi:ketosteroid isomerase-like protein
LAENATWEVPGDTANVPWLGKRVGAEIADFFAAMAESSTREAFDVEHGVFDGPNAVLIGRARVIFTSNGNTIDTPFALHFVVGEDDRITSVYMFEDSWSVALAVRPTLADVPARAEASSPGER